MNKIAKKALITGTVLCVAGVILSTAGYFAGGRDFTYVSDHFYISGEDSSEKNLSVMEKEQIDAFARLNVDFEDLDLDIRLSEDDHYYMEYSLATNGRKDPLIWEDKDGELTLKEAESGVDSYYVTYDLGIIGTNITQEEDIVNTVILYVPEKVQLSSMDVRLSDGELTLEQLFCKKMKAELSNGDMTVDKGVFESFEAKLEDGNLQMCDSSFGKDAEIRNSNGDVFIEMKNGSAAKTNIHLEAANGDVDTEDLPQGDVSGEEDISVYENKADSSAPTLNVKCEDGDITLTQAGN